MHVRKLSLGELVASVSGILLARSLFMHWYATDASNRYSRLNGMPRVALSAWDTQPVLRIIFLAAAVSPLVLDWVIIRDHALSWPRGELTAVIAIIIIVLLLVAGFVTKPGQPVGTITLQTGWFLAMVGAIGMLIGSAKRTAKSGRPRKPPGVI